MDWGFQASDTRRALRLCPDAVRTAAAQCLAMWQAKGFDLGPEEAWRKGFGPLFAQVWPQERRFKNAQLTIHLARFCVNTAIESTCSSCMTPICQRFPQETLEFLWCLCSQQQLRWLRFWFIVKKW